MKSAFTLLAAIVFAAAADRPAHCEDKEAKRDELHGLPLLVAEDFEKGADRWQPTDPKAWRVSEGRGGKVYDQFVKQSKYEPTHRSPFNFALLKDVTVGDFALTAKVRSTVADYGHRDACIIFGYQDKSHFYYVHFGKKTDDHANQVFIVNDKPRLKISTKTTDGTAWDDAWHDVKIVRRVEEGSIEVYFDDMKTPVMTAADKSFAWGQIGIGTFDDTSMWDDVRLFGTTVDKNLGYLRLPDDEERKIGHDVPESALRGLPRVTKVTKTTYDEYLDVKRRLESSIRAQESRDGHLYCAVEEHRDVPFPNGTSAYVPIIFRYKAPLPRDKQ